MLFGLPQTVQLRIIARLAWEIEHEMCGNPKGIMTVAYKRKIVCLRLSENETIKKESVGKWQCSVKPNAHSCCEISFQATLGNVSCVKFFSLQTSLFHFDHLTRLRRELKYHHVFISYGGLHPKTFSSLIVLCAERNQLWTDDF